MSENNFKKGLENDLKPEKVKHNLRVEFTNGQTEFYHEVTLPSSDNTLDYSLFDEKNKFLQFTALHLLDTRKIQKVAINKSVIAKAELTEALVSW